MKGKKTMHIRIPISYYEDLQKITQRMSNETSRNVHLWEGIPVMVDRRKRKKGERWNDDSWFF